MSKRLKLFKTIYNKMKKHNVTIKLHKNTVVNSDFLNDRIRRFLRNTKFDSNFISLIIKISANSNSFWRTIFKMLDGQINTIKIKDSLLLLPSSLASLAKSFGFEDKGLFPYTFPNKNNLSYIGKVPNYKYFDHKKV